MAINNKNIEDFNKMFGLESDNKSRESELKGKESDEQFEEYATSTDVEEPFEVLAKELSDEIRDSEHKGYSIGIPEIKNPHDIVREVCASPIEEVECTINDTVDNKDDDFFDDMDEGEWSSCADDTIGNDSEDESSVVDRIDSNDSFDALFVEDDAKDNVEDNIDIDKKESYISKEDDHMYEEDIGEGDDSVGWMLESPSAMYNSFYEKKRDLLFKYMVGGEIKYKAWTKELEEANVIIQGEVFDHDLIIKQMEAVQQYRERVKSIHVKVNNQYFTFKRFIDMMRGFLARIEYLKPVARQEGLIMEHMRDLELYYARLEALHDSATKTEKTLSAAFETLSRKCTICMELKAPERIDMNLRESNSYYKHNKSKDYDYIEEKKSSREYDKSLEDFDDLPVHAKAAPTVKKTGAIGWGDI